VVFKTDEEKIKDIVKDMCNTDHTVGMRHTHDDCLFIRPTGNPLDMKGWDAMMNNDKVRVDSNELVSINKMKIVGDMAFVCYTNHGKFNYMGNENDDIAVLTSVLQRVDGRWIVIHGQRSTGRSPNDPLPVFSN
jgi:ketosteroid isomerase-like protein